MDTMEEVINRLNTVMMEEKMSGQETRLILNAYSRAHRAKKKEKKNPNFICATWTITHLAANSETGEGVLIDPGTGTLGSSKDKDLRAVRLFPEGGMKLGSIWFNTNVTTTNSLTFSL